MISLFERELIAMEREVRDLKTIHQRGLGTTRFYSATSTKNVASSMGFVSFTITPEADSPTPIALVPAVSLPEPVAVSLIVFEISNGGDYATITTMAFTPGDVKVKAICSSPIESIT